MAMTPINYEYVLKTYSSLMQAVQQAGGKVWEWEDTKRMNIIQIFEILGRNKIRFEYDDTIIEEE